MTDIPTLKPLHCGVSVANMNNSISWYQKILGFKLLWRKTLDSLDSEIAFLRHGDFEIELFCHRKTLPLPPERSEPLTDIQTQGFKHICFSVENIDTLFTQFKTKGADIVFNPHIMEGMMMGFIRDNTGNLIEFIEQPN